MLLAAGLSRGLDHHIPSHDPWRLSTSRQHLWRVIIQALGLANRKGTHNPQGPLSHSAVDLQGSALESHQCGSPEVRVLVQDLHTGLTWRPLRVGDRFDAHD